MSQQAAVIFRHIGICTSDLEHSLRFYTEALGFSLVRSIDELGAPFDTLLALPGARFKAHQVQLGGVTLELLGFSNTDILGPAEPRPMNQLGITHLTLAVDDMDTMLVRIAKFGGRVLPETRVDSPFGPIVFCSDPDGVRIELMQHGSG